MIFALYQAFLQNKTVVGFIKYFIVVRLFSSLSFFSALIFRAQKSFFLVRPLVLAKAKDGMAS